MNSLTFDEKHDAFERRAGKERQVVSQAAGATFTAKEAAVLVKSAWLVGLRARQGEAMFSPAELSQICALVGLSSQQSQALNHELS